MRELSIIVPIDSENKRIEKCLDLIVNQKDFDYEVIVLYAGTNSNTINLIKSFEEKYSENILFVSCEEGTKTSTLINIGLSYSTGTYVSFMQIEDEINIDYYSKMLALSDNEKAHIIYPNLSTPIKKSLLDMSSDDKTAFNILPIVADTCWGKLYKREFINDTGIVFSEDIVYGSDILFNETSFVFARFVALSEQVYTHKDYNVPNPLNEDYLVDMFLSQQGFASIVIEYSKENISLCEDVVYEQILRLYKKCKLGGDILLFEHYAPTFSERLKELFPNIDMNISALENTDPDSMYVFSSLNDKLPVGNLYNSIYAVSGSNNCCGCTACSFVCPVDAIEIVKDKRESDVASVDMDKCVGCGKCQKVCPMLTRNSNKRIANRIVAMKAKDDRHRRESMSGGVFGALAEIFIGSFDGIVYGAKQNGDLTVEYGRADTIDKVLPIKKSKYVQAYLGDTIASIQKDLESGKKVLIGGTSCHLHGLIKGLEEKNVNIENLYTVDLICHGVTVPIIYHRYLDYLKSSYGKKIQKFIFRDKLNFGWSSGVETIQFDDKETIHSQKYAEFLSHNLALNNPCYSCGFYGFDRETDVTIGDYWGVENKIPEWDDNMGVSLFIQRTKKAEELFNMIKDSFLFLDIERKECLQPNLEGSTNRPPNYIDFWKDYYKLPTRVAMKKYQFFPFDHMSNASTLNTLREQLSTGTDWKDKLSLLGVKKVAIYGYEQGNVIIANRLAQLGVFITAMDVFPGDTKGFLETIGDADHIVITDEEMMPEILMDFSNSGFDLDKVIPLSYLVLEEAKVDE